MTKNSSGNIASFSFYEFDNKEPQTVLVSHFIKMENWSDKTTWQQTSSSIEKF